MISRFIISILLIPVLFFAIYLKVENFIFLYTLILILSILANFELSRLFRRAYSVYLNIFEYSTYVFNFLLIYTFFFSRLNNSGNTLPLLIVAFVVVFSIVLLIFKKPGLRQIFLFLVSFIYTGLIPLLIVAIRYTRYGDLLVYLLFLMVWINDASALFIGTKFGKIKGLVKYSPNKTLEGYIGSFFITVTVAVLFKLILSGRLCLTFSQVVITSMTISITGHLGDILESAIKRKADVKDSSRLFFGLGGILDIFDSVIASIPFYYLFIKLYCTRG